MLVSVAQAETVMKTSLNHREKPDFTDYQETVFSGEIRIPKEFTVDKDGIWRDSAGKIISMPSINFSGKYFLSTHSCGAGCRYYQLTDLTTGNSIPIMHMFASTDPPAKTSDGYQYTTILFYRPESSMLVAQYEIQKKETLECRERLFVLKEMKLKQITETRRYCNNWRL